MILDEQVWKKIENFMLTASEHDAHHAERLTQIEKWREVQEKWTAQAKKWTAEEKRWHAEERKLRAEHTRQHKLEIAELRTMLKGTAILIAENAREQRRTEKMVQATQKDLDTLTKTVDRIIRKRI